MGKEIRVGLAVVGVLLVLFCGVLLGRLSQTNGGPPDVSIPVGDAPTPAARAPSPGAGRLYPTVVKTPAWNAFDGPAAENPTRAASDRSNSADRRPADGAADWSEGAGASAPRRSP